MSTGSSSLPELRIVLSTAGASDSANLSDRLRNLLQGEFDGVLVEQEGFDSEIPAAAPAHVMLVRSAPDSLPLAELVLATTKVVTGSALCALELMTGVPGLHALLTALGMEGVFFVGSILEGFSEKTFKNQKKNSKG